MNEFALLNGKHVVRVVRKDHYGNKTIWLVEPVDKHPAAVHLRFVPRKDCTLLDPALNVLFERKSND